MTSWLNYERDAGVAPRKAAAVILFEQTTSSVLLVQRNTSLAFMGGHHAFPGGGISHADTGRCVRAVDDGELARAVTAAVRELFEETGVLLATGAEVTEQQQAAWRAELLQQPEVFEVRLDEAGLHIPGDRFVPVSRWVTPTFAPKRFDTQYFLYRSETLQPASPIGDDGEITDTTWLNVCEALDLRAKDSIQLSTPVAFVLRRLAMLPLHEALERLQHTPGFSELIFEYIEPEHGIHIVPLVSKTLPPANHTNCVLVGETELAIIDPGIDDAVAWKRFERHLDEILEMAGGDLYAILLTHDHFDHSAAAHRLGRRYNVPVYAHASCREKDISLVHDACIELAGTPPWRIRCIHTPGHHPGHFTFYEKTTDTLMCGDLIANPGTVVIDPECGGDMNAYMRSLERIATLTPRMTIPAHGAPLMGHAGPAHIQHTIAHRRMRAARIRTALEQGARTFESLLEIAYDDTPRSMYPWARRQLQAHLNAMNIAVS